MNKDNMEEDNRGGTATISDDIEAGQRDYNNLTLSVRCGLRTCMWVEVPT